MSMRSPTSDAAIGRELARPGPCHLVTMARMQYPALKAFAGSAEIDLQALCLPRDERLEVGMRVAEPSSKCAASLTLDLRHGGEEPGGVLVEQVELVLFG
jgi:hypothetical protein